MKKPFVISLIVHLFLLGFFNFGNGQGNDGKTGPTAENEQKEEQGKFLGQENKPVEVIPFTESDISKMDRERKEYLKELKKDCGKDSYGGIGVMGYSNLDDTLIIVLEVAKGSPAERAGVVPHDTLYSVGPMRGDPGENVSLTIEKSALEGFGKRTVTLTRELICYSKTGVSVIPNK